MPNTLTIPHNIGEVLEYDPLSPSGLRWKVTRGGKAVSGSVAGYIFEHERTGRKGWQVRHASPEYGDHLYMAHRVVWFLKTGEQVPAGLEVDHKDGNALNNKIDNLRVVTRKVNARNQGLRADNNTGVIGVTLITPENERHTPYYVAYFLNSQGERESKQFSFFKYGKEKAFELAKDFRRSGMLKLHKRGARYSQRHLELSGVEI